MSKKNEELRVLQHHWYRLLAESGFEDIEKIHGNGLVLIEKSSMCVMDLSPAERFDREEYYRFLGHKVNDERTIFRSPEDEFIMNRYAEGAKIATIVKELNGKGILRERKSIRILIRRYEQEWKMKSYSRRQLNLKD